MASRPRLLATGIVGSVVLADQVTKWWALNSLDSRDIHLAWTLRLHLVMNKGSAFGLGSRYTPVITLLAMTIVAFFLRTSPKFTKPWPRFAVALIVAGALGNLLDRVFRGGDGILGGAVVDFISLDWWPVFNIADIAITVGAILMVLTGGSDDRRA